MPREALQIIAADAKIDMQLEDSARIYDYLTGEITESKHGQRFDVRPFNTDPDESGRPSPLDAAYPYMVANEVEPDTQMKMARTTGDLIMPSDNFDALINAFQSIHDDEAIKKHKLLGGSVLFMCNHLTYADLPVSLAASTIAKLNLGVDDPQNTQDVIIHRLISSFAHDLISTAYVLNGLEQVNGYIMEDVILLYASALQTLPNSSSGYTKLIEKVKSGAELRSMTNTAGNQVFPKLSRLGGRDFFVAGSGQEMVYSKDDNMLHERQLGRGTTDMLVGPNEIQHAEQILTIPFYMHADPFTGDKETLLKPTPTPFAFLTPRYATKPGDLHRAMAEIIAVGNTFKPSGVPQLAYDYYGPAPEWFISRDIDPLAMITHSV